MYSRLPAFVFGFHGCDLETKENVLHNGHMLHPSRNPYDWLGNGIYFWEQNPQRAMEFATLAMEKPGKYTSKPIYVPAVLGAVIDLGNCLNLMDSVSIEAVRIAYERLMLIHQQNGTPLSANYGKSPDKPLRYLDCAVIETLHSLQVDYDQPPYDSVRGLFVEHPQLYPDSGFFKNTHIQICVRNTNCIKAFFDPREKAYSPFITDR